MDFIKAVEEMKKGKKVRIVELTSVDEHFYYYLEDTQLIGANGVGQVFDTEFLDFTWEIVEEKKP